MPDDLFTPKQPDAGLAPPTPPVHRDFLDVDTTRSNIFDGVLKGVQESYPIANDKYELHISNPKYSGQDKFSIAEQKDAILQQRTLDRPIKGTWTLKDKQTGQVVSQADKVIARVPYLTHRGTFIFKGNEYTVANQQRLRPGVYARQKDNGEMESHVNLMPGTGKSFRLHMEPDTGIFKLQVGQSHVPLFSVLKALGAQDSEIIKRWGPELYEKNALKSDPGLVRKTFDHFADVKTKAAFASDASAGLRHIFSKMGLDPEVSSRNLGHPHSAVDKDVILRATQKLLHVHQGKEEPDDRDSQANQTIHGPEDLFKERITKDAGRIARQLLWKSTFRKNVDHVRSGALTPQLHSVLLTSGLGQPLSEINPMEIVDQRIRVTRLGEGGIGSVDAVPMECYDVATEVFTATGWQRWQDVGVHTEFACLIDGCLTYRRPFRVFSNHYTGKMYGVRTRTLDYLVTPNHRVWCRKYRGPSSVARCGLASWDFELAQHTHNKPREFLVSHGAFTGNYVGTEYVLPTCEGARKQYSFDPEDFAEFLGWWISEGSIDAYAKRQRSKYHITISQNKDANPEKTKRIAALLARMHIPHSYQGHNFVFVSKQIGMWLEQNAGLGCINKRIPEECFFWTVEMRRRLLESLVLGDGSTRENTARVYVSSSVELVQQVARLATTLGYATSSRKPGHRENSKWLPQQTCGILLSKTQGITDKHRYADVYYIRTYSDVVYCAEVPGGLLLVRRNSSTPMWSGNSRGVQPSQLGYVDHILGPESERIGVDSRLAFGTRKGADNLLYQEMNNPRTGKPEWVSARDAVHKVLAFAGELDDPNAKIVRAMKNGRIHYVDRTEVDYAVPNPENTLSLGANMVPSVQGIKGGRLLMGGKMIRQALPLRNAEAPLVQSAHPKGDSFEYHIGEHIGAVRAHQAGIVHQVTPDSISVQYDDGTREEKELYNNFPFNYKTFLHNTPVVKPGDRFNANQLLAKSNYTDKEGRLAMGTNLKVGYMPYQTHHGNNYEDAIVISESAAKKLTSEHMYQHTYEPGEGKTIGRNEFLSKFPSRFNKQQLASIDTNGVVKPGTIVRKEDPLVLAVHERKPQQGEQIHRSNRATHHDDALTWDSKHEGMVTDVHADSHGIKVTVKSYSPMGVGDKLSGRFGDKGVIGAIVPDDQMPRNTDGSPLEILLNSLGIITRTNPSQVIEAMLGKVAAKTGKPYQLRGFKKENSVHLAQRELAAHGLSDTDRIYDPHTKRHIDILSGNRFFYKLYHTAESKESGRDTGAYTDEEQPAKGGPEGAKRLGLLDINALISHGACFLGSANVLTEHGWLEISKIVGKRLPVKVACADVRTGELQYRPVIDWLCRSVPEDDLVAVDTYARSGAIRGARRSIKCTKGHQFYTPGGKVQAYYLKPGDTIFTPGTHVDHWQEQLIMGTLMGDGYVSLRSATVCGGLACCHGHAQRDYLEWKYDKLANLGVSRPKTQRLSVGGFAKKPTSRFTLRQHSTVSKLAKEFYVNGAKQPPIDIVSRMGWLGLGVWFGDDGGCLYSKRSKRIVGFTIHTCAFSVAAVVQLAKELTEFTGVPWRYVMKSGKYPVLTLTNGKNGADNLKIFTDKLQPYLPPTLAYKLRRETCGWAWSSLKPTDKQWFEETTVRSVRPYKLAAYEASLVYNITVAEYHNYVVHGVLVGNTEVLKDAKLIRGQKNDKFWQAFRMGYPAPMPETPMIYHKWLAHLQGAGIHVERDGNKMHIMALTDKDIDQLSKGALEHGKAVNRNGNKPIPGGLFDEGLTGGHHGTGWSHIELHQPLPNPVLEEPIRRLLGMTKTKFEEKIAEPGGPAEIRRQLSQVNVNQAIDLQKQIIGSGKKSKRDNAIRVLSYLTMAKERNIHPAEWMLSKFPVIPPVFRPIHQVDGVELTSDANHLYSELFEADKLAKSAKKEGLSGGEEQLNTYKAMKAVAGLGDPLSTQLQDKKVAGLLEHVFGKGSPKCYDADTEILTRNGWVSFPAYDGSVEVATLNPGTDTFEWQLPTDVIHQKYAGPMVQTKTSQIDLLVTPNHHHWVKSRRGRGNNIRWEEFKKVEAGELANVCRRVQYKTAAGNWNGAVPSADFNGHRPDATAFAEFVGWWLAEGWNHEDGCTAYVCQTANSPDWAAIDSTFSRLNLPYRRDNYDKVWKGHKFQVTYWAISLADLVTWLRTNVGDGAGNKKLSAEVLNWDKPFLEKLLVAYLAGDGEKRKLRQQANPDRKLTFRSRSKLTDLCARFSTTSFALGESLQELALKIGLRLVRGSLVTSDNEKWNDQYRSTIRGWDCVLVEYKKQTTTIDYAGSVHCVTVPNGLVFVRRNGLVAVSGNSGMFQRRVLANTLDVVGRAAITPNPALDMDHVGLPESKAWQIYRPFIMRRLARRYNVGDQKVPMTEIAKWIVDKHPLAKAALMEEISERPVLINRAPVWHKYGFMAAWPKLVKGETLHISPITTPGFNADFDGDTMNYSVPVSDEAVQQAVEKMLPSRNLFAARNFDVHLLPRQEYLHGLFLMTRKVEGEKPKTPREFESVAAVRAAYLRGEINARDPVVIRSTR